MLKLQNEKGEVVFKVKDHASKPEKVITSEKDYCPKCHQSGDEKCGEYPCPDCRRNMSWDDSWNEENTEENK